MKEKPDKNRNAAKAKKSSKNIKGRQNKNQKGRKNKTSSKSTKKQDSNGKAREEKKNSNKNMKEKHDINGKAVGTKTWVQRQKGMRNKTSSKNIKIKTRQKPERQEEQNLKYRNKKLLGTKPQAKT